MVRTRAWGVWGLLLLSACEIHSYDDDWHEDDAYSYPEPPARVPGSSPSFAPASPDASAPLSPSQPARDPRTGLTAAVAWRAGESWDLRSLPAAGSFPDSFTIATASLAPPANALVSITTAGQETKIAYGYVVGARPDLGPAARHDAGACSRAPDAGCGSSTPPVPPPLAIEGVASGHLVFYTERTIAAGTLLSALFNEYQTIPAGVHLLRLLETEASARPAIEACQQAASQRAVERYNALHATDYRSSEELRQELWWTSTLLDAEEAARCDREYSSLERTAMLEFRCSFSLRAVVAPASTTCLTVTSGARLTPLVPPLS